MQQDNISKSLLLSFIYELGSSRESLFCGFALYTLALKNKIFWQKPRCDSESILATMGRKKRSSQNPNQDNEETKKVKTETGESYLVKKYRPTKIYAAMEAFVKYTKSHRMLDASYVRWKTGVSPEKPFVFSTRVGGVDLGWGRGKTREAAMDCACRAAFALVSAHGYNNFPIDDDCLMQAPVDLPPPPPPPLLAAFTFWVENKY